MNIYKCPKYGSKFFEFELIRTKCSENYVGTYISTICPRCSNKRKPIYIELEKE